MPDLLGFFAHNPIIAHLQRRAATDRLSIGRLLWWVFGGGLLLLAMSVWAVQNSYFRIMGGAWLLAWAVSFGVPMAAAGTAAFLTVRDIQSGPFDLLYMSQLSDEAIVGGYVALSLYRVRPLIALVMAILPLHVVAAFYTLIETNARVSHLSAYIMPRPPSQFEILLPTFVFLVVAIGLWALSGLGALIGVRTALRSRDTLQASLIAPLLTAGAGLLVTLPIWLGLMFPQAIQILMSLCAPVGYVGAYFIIWETTFRQAADDVRRPIIFSSRR